MSWSRSNHFALKQKCTYMHCSIEYFEIVATKLRVCKRLISSCQTQGRKQSIQYVLLVATCAIPNTGLYQPPCTTIQEYVYLLQVNTVMK